MRTAVSGALSGTLLMVPATASAHVAMQTVALLSGAVQPWAMSDSAALLGASALWLAQAASSTDTRFYLLTSAALAAGAGAGLARPSTVPPSWLYVLALGISLAVCTRRRPHDTAWRLILCAAAAIAGYRAAADAAGGVANPLIFVGGVFAGGLVALLAVGVALARQSNKIIAVGTRIIASWVAALSAMMVALSLRG